MQRHEETSEIDFSKVGDALDPGVRVGPSPIGLGVFAVREFMPTEAIGRVDGITIDDPEHGSDYCMELSEKLGLEPAAPFRFINHSCRPNCTLTQVRVLWDDDEGQDDEGQDDEGQDDEGQDDEGQDDGAPVERELWIEALGQIPPGEQLTIDYAWPADSAIPCGCGSSNCRGWIVAEEELDQLTE